MLPYTDIHTHRAAVDPSIFQLVNYIVPQGQIPQAICSAGIHPWYIDSHFEHQLSLLKELASQGHVIAIGECGLDKICHTPWDTQIKAFEQQIQLANVLKKPLIVHCVRAYEETMQILKLQKVEVPVLFHGVNKKYALIQSLLNRGYYISLGAFILSGNHDKMIQTIDLAKIFLETDDKSTDIVDIYSYFCRVRNISVDLLKQRLIENIVNVFSYDIVPQ